MTAYPFTTHYEGINTQQPIIDRRDYSRFINERRPFDSTITAIEPFARIPFTYCETKALSEGRHVPSDFEYVYNNYGHRCDDFGQSHGETHILFAGDSFTVGEGLPYKVNWSGLLHASAERHHAGIGYYALAFSGGSIDLIVNNIFRYVRMFGKPDLIMLVVPEASRHYLWDGSKFISLVATVDFSLNYWVHRENYLDDAFRALYALETFCLSSDIELVWTTWDTKDLEAFSHMPFHRLMQYSFDDIEDRCRNGELVDHKYYEVARDHTHPGIKYNIGLSQLMKEFYEKTYPEAKVTF